MASPSAVIYTPQGDSNSDSDTYGSDFSPELIERLVAITTLKEQDPKDIEDIAGSSNAQNGSHHVRRRSANGWQTHYPVLAALRAACSPEPMDVAMDVSLTTTIPEPRYTSATTSRSSLLDMPPQTS